MFPESLQIVRRLKGLLKEATSECMSNLTSMTALPFVGPVSASLSSSIADFEGGNP